jgi:hypothetical protein
MPMSVSYYASLLSLVVSVTIILAICVHGFVWLF